VVGRIPGMVYLEKQFSYCTHRRIIKYIFKYLGEEKFNACVHLSRKALSIMHEFEGYLLDKCILSSRFSVSSVLYSSL